MKPLGHSFNIENVQYDYPALIKFIYDNGEVSNPRGMETREVFDVVIKLDPHYAIVQGINRKASEKLISMEALQLITCTSYPQRTVQAAPNMARFMDGEAFHGPYGVRIGAQLEAAINRLKYDRDSRQALITIWDPVLDAFRSDQAKDVPCTTMLQFFIRNNKLVLHVTMRSNDVWWGTPHDWGQFSQLQLAMANVLDVTAGDYYHHVVSFHLYQHDYDKIDTLTEPKSQLFRHDGLGARGMTLKEMKEHATKVIETPNSFTPFSATDMWHLTTQKRISEK